MTKGTADPTYRLAIDIGGTFTDVVLINGGEGTVVFAKVLSTPKDPSEGSLAGAREILDRHGIEAEAVSEVVHATTVATNSVLERKGARTGLITTRGFRDILEMGREARYDIYDLGLRVPEPLVPRQRRLEVDERLTFEGEVLKPLEDDEVAEVLRQLVEDAGVTSLAVSLLHGYAYPAHERRIVEIAAKRYPDLTISVSHRVAGEAREFERTSTTVIDAYVKPLVQRYVRRLTNGLRDLGLRQEVSMMLSHGGIGPAGEVANSFPVRMIESGPAAGAIAAAYFAKSALEQPNAIAFDMGGTTAKMSVIRDGEAAVTHEHEVAHVHRFKRGSGFPLQVSAIELLEIGAGGGSIAHVNNLGLLNVGPQSAGASPGPACYGNGGKRPTVTDADLLLGYLDPDHFLGGDMKLDAALSAAAIATHVAERLNMSVEQVAWGIHDVVNEHMAAATRAHAAEKGIDLRRYSMIAFGGAGPVHAYAMARKLGLGRIVCPFGAGVASAIGCLVAPPAIDVVAAYAGLLDGIDWIAVKERYDAMRQSGEAVLAGLVGSRESLTLQGAVDVRCEGQGYSVTVPMPDGVPVDGAMAGALTDRFAGIYQQIYGHRPPDVALEVVNLRARIGRSRADLALKLGNGGSADGDDSMLKGRRPVYFEAAGGFAESAVYDRYRLPIGESLSGPAVVEERETSIVVGPDAAFHLDEAANLVINFTD